MITEKQREARRNGIGGSDIAIILGLSKYKTPYQLFLEKKGILNDFKETDAQYWGNTLEPVLRAEFAKRNNVSIEEPMDTIIHPLYPFMRANLDGIITDLKAIWEGKTAGFHMRDKWGEPGSDVIPLEYLVQIAFYCSVTNLDTAYLSVLIGGQDYREFVYKRDHTLEDKILTAACDFWECVQKDTAPECVDVEDIKLKYDRSVENKILECTEDLCEVVNDLKELNKQIKQLEESVSIQKKKIMAHMQDAEILTHENQMLCTWKTNKKGSRTFYLRNN